MVSVVNSNAKGKVGERDWAEYLRGQGYEARRGQQFCGSPDSPDVVSSVPGVHWEVKNVQSIQILAALEQANSEKKEDEMGIVAFHKSNKPWVAILLMDDLMKLIKAAKPTEQQNPDLKVSP